MPKPWPFATRLNSFKPVAEGPHAPGLLRAAATVPGLNAVELNYPQHFTTQPELELRTAIADSGLRPTGINLRYEGAEFADGAFTSPREATRERAIRIALEAVDQAAALGAGHVVLWMADDGFDYPFQVDYSRLWERELLGFRRVAEHDPAIRVSVEYKPTEPRRFALIRSMGDALLAVREVGLANFGVTLDVCHALMAGEHPGASAALALRERKLFGVHLNEGYGRGDDGLAVGRVHPTTTLEVLWQLRRGGYEGTIYFDTFPVREHPVAECAANIAWVQRALAALGRLDIDALAAAQEAQDAMAVGRLVGLASGGLDRFAAST